MNLTGASRWRFARFSRVPGVPSWFPPRQVIFIVRQVKRALAVRDPRRIDDVLLAIGEVWALDPDLRLGQLLYVALRPAEPCPELSGVEDRDLVRQVHAVAERLRAAKQAEQNVAGDRGSQPS